MGKVFVSYARADKPIVARLVAALRKIGVEPWWDDDIAPGVGWEEAIERALAEAGSAIVCWSTTSVASENVRSEARLARARGCLVQIFLEKCDPPLFFGERQGIDFSDWNRSVDAPQIERLGQALHSIAPSAELAVEGAKRARKKHLRLPRFLLAGGTAVVAAASITGWWWIGRTQAAGPARIALQPIEALGLKPAPLLTASLIKSPRH